MPQNKTETMPDRLHASPIMYDKNANKTTKIGSRTPWSEEMTPVLNAMLLTIAMAIPAIIGITSRVSTTLVSRYLVAVAEPFLVAIAQQLLPTLNLWWQHAEIINQVMDINSLLTDEHGTEEDYEEG